MRAGRHEALRVQSASRRVADGRLVNGDADSGLVAEDDTAVGVRLIDRHPERRTKVLHFGSQVVGYGRGGMSDSDVRGEPHRADRQVAAMGGVSDAEKMTDTPDASRLNDVDRVVLEQR